MSKNFTLVTTLVVVIFFSSIEGKPWIETKNTDADATDSMDSGINPRIGDWTNFNKKWSFPSFASIGNFFTDDTDDKDFSLVKMRIDNLEHGQRKIAEMLEKITQDFLVFSTLLEEQRATSRKESPILPVESANKVKETLIQDKTTPSAIDVTTIINENEGQTPTMNEKPEVTIQPVVIEESVTQTHLNPNFTIDKSN